MLDVDPFMHGKEWLLATGTISLLMGDRGGSVVIIPSVSCSGFAWAFVAWIGAQPKMNSAAVFLGWESETLCSPPCCSLSSSWVLACTGTFHRDTGTRTAAVAELCPRTTEFHSDKSDTTQNSSFLVPRQGFGWCISGSRRAHGA